MALTLDQLLATPDYYLHSFVGEDALFVPMDRQAYRRSIFLDGRIQPAADGTMRVPVDALLPAARPAHTIGWIFHIAHCGSTLLARAIGELAPNLVLREPQALRQMAFGADDTGIALVRTFLARRYEAAIPTIVKANVPVNFLLDRLMTTGTEDRAILLHYGLRDYLLAILRNDNHRAWLYQVTADLANMLGDLSSLTDAERGAALWLAQTRRFAATLERSERAAVLDAEHFFAEPANALAASMRHLGIATEDAAIADLVAGPLFATYSKNPGMAFDNAARVARRAETERELAGELKMAEEWLARVAPDSAALDAALATRRL